MSAWGGNRGGESAEPSDRAGAIRVASEWLAAVNASDDDTAVRLSAFSVAQLGLVRRSLAGAQSWNATAYRHEYAPGIEQLMFVDGVSGRSGKLLVQQTGDEWKVLALLEADGTTFPRAPAPVETRAVRGRRTPPGRS